MTAGASSSRLKLDRKPTETSRLRPKPFVSVRAEPISDDDFSEVAKEEADRYGLARKQQAERERIKAENKQRKKQGLPALKVPSRFKDPSLRNRFEESDDEAPLADDSRGTDGRTRSSPQAKRSDKRSNDELEYEGQVILPFNPLYILSGLPDPEKCSNAASRAKLDFLNRHSGLSSRSSSTPEDEVSVQAKPIESKERGNDISTLTAPGKLEGLSQDEQEPPAEMDDPEEAVYDEEEEIFVPWNAPTKVESETEDGEEPGRIDEDGFYSEDELFARPHHKDGEPSQQLNSLPYGSAEIAPYRPSFQVSEAQAAIGALSLDPNSPDIAVPSPINRFLKEYQKLGTQFFYNKYQERTGGVLGDEMGLGKTIQVIAFLSAIMRKTGTSEDYQRRKKEIRRGGTDLPPRHWPTALIVCPSSLVRNWSRELDTWGYFEYQISRTSNWEEVRTSFLRGYLDLILVSYDTCRITAEHLKDLPFSVVIADEAHRIKEPRAAGTLALKKIKCSSCFALTGTLVQNRMEEMWSVLDFVHRGWAGTLKQWRDFAVNPIKKGHRHEGSAREVVEGIMRLGVMYDKVLPHFYLRRDKRLIAHELPPKRDMVVFCPLAARQVMAYQALIDSEDVQFILKRNDDCECGSGQKRLACCHSTNEHGETLPELILKNMNALQKVANHCGLLYHAKDDSQHTMEVNRKIFKICTGEDYDGKRHNVVEASLDPANCGKWVLLAKLLKQWRDEDSENKVLIFSNSVRLLKMIAEFISTSFSGFSFEMLTGEVSEKEKMEMVDNFQDMEKDHYILLISTLAGGVGLNLTAANKVVIFDPDWNPANDLQAMDRAVRIGQKRVVDVYRLIGQGTLEELKYERQIHKQQRAHQLNQGTFERRIHQGYDGARDVEGQGELFGTHNIFKFNPNGFVSGNLERVRLAEDQFVQDVIEAEFDSDDEDAYDSEGEAGRKMREERRRRQQRQAQQMALKRREQQYLKDALGDETPNDQNKGEDILKSLGVTTHDHSGAFRDSPEERKIYEIGLKLLRDNPDLARTMKANDLGKLAKTTMNRTERPTQSKLKRKATDPDEEPWRERLLARSSRPAGKRNLAELSDGD
ncbi:P-loop containing nucleoside triphosphate hydrolase protein [Naematelia encephala]|uniref:p-loop containing nucleoside triphosphate hydrolase protein n=1 Tax=Naematelia encephala TaxID=71784 RepID=A0A1Y2B6U5_9TREE|nr:P-loop containing nucleoside triphosphate hydrolase protein [Naematelia encephala]